MGFSPLADMSRRIPDGGRSSPRQARVSGFTIHHNAGVDAFGQASALGREVSAQYWITNAGVIIPNVDETRRAWTTGAAGYPAGAEADHRNITVEVSNSPEGVRDGTWAISPAAEASLSALIGDVFRRYSLGPVRRAAVGGVAVHQDFVPTQCPGNFIMANLGRIIDRANSGGEAAEEPAPEVEEEDEEMARNVCVATKHESTHRVRIFDLVSGEEHQFSSGDMKYIENVATTYGCALVSYITNSHYAQIGGELAATRDRIEARA